MRRKRLRLFAHQPHQVRHHRAVVAAGVGAALYDVLVVDVQHVALLFRYKVIAGVRPHKAEHVAEHAALFQLFEDGARAAFVRADEPHRPPLHQAHPPCGHGHLFALAVGLQTRLEAVEHGGVFAFRHSVKE